MSDLLAGVDIGGIIASHLTGRDLTLRRYTDGAPNADINAGFVRTTTDYPCTGYAGAVQISHVREDLIRKGMVVYGLHGASLTVRPSLNDEVIDDGKAYRVYEVDGDSVKAVWVVYTCAVTT